MIGYTTGVFDLFHIGHLNLLRQAKSRCNFLIVGVTVDNLVKQYKNIDPVIPFDQRIQIISSLRCVDMAVPQTTMLKTDAWDLYHFDVMFVGSDWENTERWNKFGKDFSEIGVDIVYIPYTKSISSTKLRGILNESKSRK